MPPARDRTAPRRLRAAADALAAGDLARAEQHLGLLAELCADDPEFLRLRALAHDARGHSPEAIRDVRQAVQARPDDAVFQNTLATVLTHAGELDEAVGALQRACALQPDLAIAWYNLGIVQARAARHDEAIAAFRRAEELDPGLPDVQVRLAEALRDSGDAAAAAGAYREIIEQHPWAGAAWQGLADLRSVRLSETDIACMRAALAAPAAGPRDRIATGYALARALEGIGDFGGSMAALEHAKMLERERGQWDAAAFSRSVAEAEGAFTPPPTGAQAPGLGREVIFIVGLPRSGTSLAEQILASHPAVEGGGELADLKAVLQAESRRRAQPYPAWVQDARPGDWERLGREYLQRTARWRRARPVSTDKLPSNWLFVDAIMAMLPAARVVCCRRDPLETCFSAYRQYRARLDYAGTFNDLAAFWRDYDRSVRRCRTHYPASVFEHRYESLLASPEAAIRTLLDACGLPWDAACLRFHENPRAVHTPSAVQVREPLRGDTARGARYGSLLDPLRAALGLPAFASRG